ncbi:MAG TPA: hypothetical protein VLG47_01055, partial [Candidatus Saccharimonadales bacterium]|nr:hypothetical protein [Candidatus Saccharimonadales bacterium]
EKDDDDDTPVAVKKVPEPPKVEKPKAAVHEPVIESDKPVDEQTELSPQERKVSDAILEQNAPELIVGTSGENLGGNELPQGMFRANVGSSEVSHDQNETPHAPEANVSAAASVAAVEAAETPQPSIAEQAEPAAFNEWVQNEHPELAAPEMAAASNNDEGFNDIVRNSLGGNPPGEARYYEHAPGQPPVDASGGHNQPPNFPPTAEGGAWGDGDDLPQGMFRANVGYTPNPNILNSPWTPAGGLTNPNTWAAIGLLQARNEINNLRHTSREYGLAGAVGLVGLGLVADHLWARRRFKKQQNQIKEQGKQLKQTNEVLQKEQAEHQLTRHKLERVSAQSSEVERPTDHLHQHHVSPVEQGAAAGFAAALIPGGEKPAPKTTKQAEQAPVLQSQELAWFKENNKEVTQSAEHGPAPQTAEFAGAAAALGAEKSKGSEQTVFNQEGTHEQLQNQYLDAGGVKKQSSSGIEAGPAPMPAVSNQAFSTSYNQSVEPYGNQFNDQDRVKSTYMKPALAGVIVFVVVLVLLFIFAR